MKSSYNIIVANGESRGTDKPTEKLGGAKRHGWAYSNKRERTNTSPVRVFHPTAPVPEYAMPLGHSTKKSVIFNK